jgi:hypothetical protein
MSAFVVAAENMQQAKAGLSHLTEGDVPLVSHVAILPKTRRGLNMPFGIGTAELRQSDLS